MNGMTVKRKIFWIGIILLIGIPVFIYVYANMLKAEPYKLALTFLIENKDVVKELGKPIKLSTNIFTGYYVEHFANSEEKAKFKISIVGEKDQSYAVIELETKQGKWYIGKAVLILMNGKEIDLDINNT
jgi:hypothetical protein